MLRYLTANRLVFLLLLALLSSNGYVWLVNHVPEGDSHYYLLLAKGDVAQVTSFHRYRVVVPLLAGSIARSIVWVRGLFGDTPGLALGLAFYLVNTTILTLAGTFIYRTARACGAGAGAALCGAGATLSSGIATYLTGSALVDSPVVLVMAALYYALATRAKLLLWWVIVVSLLIKEQLLPVLAVALWYGHFLPWQRRLTAMLLAGMLLLGLYMGLDMLYPVPAATRFTDLPLVLAGHFRYALLPTLSLLATPKGLWAMLSVFGGFNLVILLGLGGGRAARRAWTSRLPSATGALLAVVLGFVLLSGEIARMLFLAAPMFGVAVALIVQYHPLAKLLHHRLQLLTS